MRLGSGGSWLAEHLVRKHADLKLSALHKNVEGFAAALGEVELGLIAATEVNSAIEKKEPG